MKQIDITIENELQCCIFSYAWDSAYFSQNWLILYGLRLFHHQKEKSLK